MMKRSNPSSEEEEEKPTTPPPPTSPPPPPTLAPEIGSIVIGIWSDGTQHKANVVDRRLVKDVELKVELVGGSMEHFEYYLHYLDYDRRMDEWIGADKIVRIVREETKTVSSETGSGKKKRRKPSKRSMSQPERTTNNPKKISAVEERKKWEEEHEKATRVKNIQCVEVGAYDIDTWYFSPYPKEYCNVDRLYICEFCLKYMKRSSSLSKHKKTCKTRHPPGNEIYREGNVSVFEVDGLENKLYCQNLCLLTKLFIEHKTLYYDVDPFLFYIVTEVDEKGCHIVGYFSKEKVSVDEYNLACILVFPPFQRRGYGKFLISLSYELTKAERKVGSPEKPLSDLGKLSFRSYWTYVLLTLLRENKDSKNLSVKDISEMTGIRTEDVISTLQSLNLIKYWKGQHIISVSQKVIETHLKSCRSPRLCKASKLRLENATLMIEDSP